MASFSATDPIGGPAPPPPRGGGGRGGEEAGPPPLLLRALPAPPPPPPPPPPRPSSAPYRTHPPASSQTCIEWKGSETVARSSGNGGGLSPPSPSLPLPPPRRPPPPLPRALGLLPSRQAPARRSAEMEAGVRVDTRSPGTAGRVSVGTGAGLASASATRRWRVAGLWAAGETRRKGRLSKKARRRKRSKKKMTHPNRTKKRKKETTHRAHRPGRGQPSPRRRWRRQTCFLRLRDRRGAKRPKTRKTKKRRGDDKSRRR